MLPTCEVVGGSGSGVGGNVGWTLIKGLSAFGVLEGEGDFGNGMVVGSTSAAEGNLFSLSSGSDTSPSSSSSP